MPIGRSQICRDSNRKLPWVAEEIHARFAVCGFAKLFVMKVCRPVAHEASRRMSHARKQISGTKARVLSTGLPARTKHLKLTPIITHCTNYLPSHWLRA